MLSIVLVVGEALLEQGVRSSGLWPLNFGNGERRVVGMMAEKKKELKENEIYR